MYNVRNNYLLKILLKKKGVNKNKTVSNYKSSLKIYSLI